MWWPLFRPACAQVCIIITHVILCSIVSCVSGVVVFHVVGLWCSLIDLCVMVT